MAYLEEQGGVPCGFIRQNSSNSISLDFEPDTEYQFVEQLEERYKCAFCHSVLHNPHQTGCGHRFCHHCILSLRELNAVPICPVDKEIIKSQEVLASHIDKSAWLEAQVHQLLQMVNQQQNKFDLRPLVEAIDTVKQKITLLETNDQRLVVLEGETNKHDAHINIHKAQLNKNEERFKLLEGACYNGKLIWKVTDYKMKKKEAVDGHTVRCGYRLCARAYLNGDGSGKGTHLSLYFVVMRGEFDSLLQWPFRQRVTLMLLDQSGKRNHIVETFRADPNSSSFKRPDGEMNIASGCPRFVAHSTLENAKNTFIKDDTLFLKVAVDLTDLEDL
ncbi:TNF receptor-associated factor 5 [Tupaia chinensis]|uniref:TNF receptor-associated factor 5 n=1 Tax=Tupaia chinensis TaxID=246437 RepID=L8YCY6_TUPCH|nr:TNF receptor-associated factor 5 [Tupaia chinensis]